MKKQLTVALGLAVLATPAFASKARLQALGEDSNGSFYISDNRNIFLNAAQVNNYSNLVTFETGFSTDDSTFTPTPEGGVFFAQENLTYGVQLGSESSISNGLRNWAGTTALEQNNIDLFVGGDAGMKWGANLTYSNTNESSSSNGDQAIRTRLGAIAGDLEGFANISLKNVAESSGGKEFEGKLGYQLGAIYNLNAYRLFAEYQSIKGEDKTSNDNIEIGSMKVGAGRTDKLNDKAHLFTKVELSRSTINDEKGVLPSAQSIQDEDVITTNLPLTIGLEYDATSWLVLRGSVSQSLYSDISAKGTSNKNLTDTTIVNTGATLKFGEFSVDGVIGNATASESVSSGLTGTNGSLRTDNLMSRVSMTYRF